MSSSMALRRSPKPGALTAQTLSMPRSLLTTRVARASPSMSSAMIRSGRPDLAICSRTGSRSFMLEIFFSWIRMYGVFEISFHPLRIGDEVRGEVAAVELHAFDDLEGGFHGLGFFNGDDAFLADLLHGLGDDVADGLVVVGGDGADLGDFLVVLDRLGDLLQLCNDGFNGLVDAALDLHRVVAGGNQLGAFGRWPGPERWRWWCRRRRRRRSWKRLP